MWEFSGDNNKESHVYWGYFENINWRTIFQFIAHNTTLDQVIGCLASGSKFAGSWNSPLWYLMFKASLAAFAT